MRKCLLKLFSLLQKRVPATITQISKLQRIELIFPSIRLLVFLNMDNSWKSTLRRLFMVGIDYQVQLMAIWHNSKPKTQKKFLATMRAIHRMGKTWRGVFSDNSSKNRGEQLCIVHRCSFQVIKASFIYLTNYAFVWSFTLVFRNTYFRSW